MLICNRWIFGRKSQLLSWFSALATSFIGSISRKQKRQYRLLRGENLVRLAVDARRFCSLVLDRRRLLLIGLESKESNSDCPESESKVAILLNLLQSWCSWTSFNECFNARFNVPFGSTFLLFLAFFFLEFFWFSAIPNICSVSAAFRKLSVRFSAIEISPV